MLNVSATIFPCFRAQINICCDNTPFLKKVVNIFCCSKAKKKKNSFLIVYVIFKKRKLSSFLIRELFSLFGLLSF